MFGAMSIPPLTLDGRSLTVADVVRAARTPGIRVTLDPAARAELVRSRGLVEAAIATGDTMYGINTGFGKLANVRIAPDQLDQLQVNLIRSHAPAWVTGSPNDVVRALMLLRANVLLRPTSGVRPELVEALVALLNAGSFPRVPEQGSVGASGDLAPLSHIALALMGEGEVLGPTARRGRTRHCAAAGPHAVPLRAQGGARVHQRHPGADGDAGAPGARCRGALANRGRAPRR